MFEVPQDKQETKTMRLLLGAAVVVVLAIVAVVYFVSQRGDDVPAISAAPTGQCTPDPTKDLRVVNAKMDKDYTGTYAVWVVRLRNQSAGCTYASVEYETIYLRPDNSVLLVNKGTLPDTIAPREEKIYSEFRDVLFPEGASWCRFKVIGATVAQP
jgi:hypothetical protein